MKDIRSDLFSIISDELSTDGETHVECDQRCLSNSGESMDHSSAFNFLSNQSFFKLLVIVFDVDGHADQCVNNIRSTAGGFDDLHICVVSDNAVAIGSDTVHKYYNKGSFSGFFWSVFDNDFNEKYKDYYVMCVLSSMRFVNGWCSYYMSQMACLSDRDVITSSVVRNAMFSFTKGHMPCRLRYVEDSGKFDTKKIRVRKQLVCSDMNVFFGIKRHSYLMDCFLLAKSSVFSCLLKDDSVSFYDFLPVISARLFTQGYDLFYSNLTYVYYGMFFDLPFYFSESDINVVKSVLGFGSLVCSGHGDLANVSRLRSLISFYFDCGFDFSRMQAV